jgi:hypothetical protein
LTPRYIVIWHVSKNGQNGIGKELFRMAIVAMAHAL